jgi:hypothetical protein
LPEDREGDAVEETGADVPTSGLLMANRADREFADATIPIEAA